MKAAVPTLAAAQGKHCDDRFERDHTDSKRSVDDNVLPLDQNIHQIDAAVKTAERDCVEAKARGQDKSDCRKKP